MASIEEKLKKQVEDRGLDFETVRKDVADGLTYEIEFYGIAGFGSRYALIGDCEEYRKLFGELQKKHGQ